MKNNQPCQVIPDEQGNAIRVSKNNSEFAHVRLQQNSTVFSLNGWVNRKTLTTLVHGKLEELRDLGFSVNEPLNGNIIILESMTPFSSKDPNRDLKIAGETGVVCKGVDQETGEVTPIYRKTVYDPTGLMQFTLIPHVNGDEIREANAGDSTSRIEEEELNNIVEQEESTTKPKSKKKDKEEVESEEETVEMEEETFEL